MCRLCDLVGAGRPRLFEAPGAEEESVSVSGGPDSNQQPEPDQGTLGAAEQEESDQVAVNALPAISGAARL